MIYRRTKNLRAVQLLLGHTKLEHTVRYLGIEGYETLLAAGVQTVALSVLLHGVTAAPLARIYGAWAKTHTTMKNPADASGT